MLLNMTGAEAQVQFAGLEHDYEKAMDRLKAQFGDKRRLTRVINEDLASQGPIKYADFKSQVEFAGKI